MVLPTDDRTDSFQEEQLGLPYWTMILAICVVVDESQKSGHSDFGIFNDLWASSIFTWVKVDTASAACPAHQAIWRWYPWLFLLSLLILMILVRWIVHKIQNHLSQCGLGVQLDLCIFGALSPIQHFSSDRCPSVRRNELLRPSSLLHRSPLSNFWLLSGSTPQFSPIFPFFVHCCFCCLNFDDLKHRNKFVNWIIMLQWIIFLSGNKIFMMIWLWFSHTPSCRFISFQVTRKSCF